MVPEALPLLPNAKNESTWSSPDLFAANRLRLRHSHTPPAPTAAAPRRPMTMPAITAPPNPPATVMRLEFEGVGPADDVVDAVEDVTEGAVLDVVDVSDPVVGTDAVVATDDVIETAVTEAKSTVEVALGAVMVDPDTTKPSSSSMTSRLFVRAVAPPEEICKA